MVFNHVLHQLPSNPEHELWCGGTQPPSVIEANYSERKLTVSVYEEGDDTHTKTIAAEPSLRREIVVPLGREIDAFTISYAAVKTVREVVGLEPEWSRSEEIARLTQEVLTQSEPAPEV